MIFFEKFHQTFGFTRTERRVVLFLVAGLVVGAGIKLYQSSFTPVKRYDYSAVDSEFIARSKTLTGNDSLVSESTPEQQDADSLANHAKTKLASPAPQSVDINSATKSELVRLPGIGEAIAERIIVYREENGRFQTIEELTNVKGIGKKKLERIAPYCRLGK